MKPYTVAVLVAAAAVFANGRLSNLPVAGNNVQLENAAAAVESVAAAPVAAVQKDLTSFLPHLEKISKLRTKIAALELSIAQVPLATTPEPAAAPAAPEAGKKGKKGKKEEKKEVVDKVKLAAKLEKKKAELAQLEQTVKTAGVDVGAEIAKLVGSAEEKLKVKEAKVAMKEAARTVEEELRQAWASKLAAENRTAYVEPLLGAVAGPIEYTQAKIAKLEAKLEEQKFRLAYLQEKEKKEKEAQAAAPTA